MKEKNRIARFLITLSLLLTSIIISVCFIIFTGKKNYTCLGSLGLPTLLSEERNLGEIRTADISQDGCLAAVIVRNRKSRMSTLYVYSLKESKRWKIAEKVLNCAWGKDSILWFDKEEENSFRVYNWQIETFKTTPFLRKAFAPCPSADGRWLVCSPYLTNGKKLIPPGNLIVYDLITGESKNIWFEKGNMPLFYEWTEDSSRLYTFCVFSKKASFSLFLLKPPSFKPTFIDSEVYPRAIRGVSWCAKDGGIVFVKRELPKDEFAGSSKVPIKAPPGFPSSAPLRISYKFWKYTEHEGREVIWQDKKYGELFAISDDGRFLLLPQENIDSKGKVYFYWELIDLRSKNVKILEKEEIKVGIGRIWYHRGIGGFCIATRKGIFLLNKQGELKTILTLERLLYESK